MGGRGVLQSAETALEVGRAPRVTMVTMGKLRGPVALPRAVGCGGLELLCGRRRRAGGRAGEGEAGASRLLQSRAGSERGRGDAGLAMRSDVGPGPPVTVGLLQGSPQPGLLAPDLDSSGLHSVVARPADSADSRRRVRRVEDTVCARSRQRPRERAGKRRSTSRTFALHWQRVRLSTRTLHLWGLKLSE